MHPSVIAQQRPKPRLSAPVPPAMADEADRVPVGRILNQPVYEDSMTENGRLCRQALACNGGKRVMTSENRLSLDVFLDDVASQFCHRS